MVRRDLAAAAAAVTLGIGGCGADLGPEDVAGTYQATQWTLSGAVDADALAEGGAITITLALDGTTRGTLIVPEALSDRGEYGVDLAGTYAVISGRVQFMQQAETFVRNLVWDVEDGRLTADGFFAGTEISVELSRVADP